MFNVKLFSFVFLLPLLIYSQKGDIINHIYEGNEEADQEKYSEAEIKYRKALSISPEETKALFNLGNTHFNDKDFDEASQRFFQTQKFSKDKNEKHMAFHNMGNVFMKKKDYAKAVESYKNALRNNPKDDETRYNYALAKELLEKEKQKDQNKDKENKEDKNKSDKKEGKNDKDDENKEDKSKNKNKDKKDKSKKNQNDRSKKENDQNQERKRKPGQLSPEQIKSILEAMSNQEKNVQKKINAKKVKGSPIKNVKDW